MKKMIAVLLILFASIICFAEPKSLIKFNGNDWISWSQEVRTYWVAGFLTANSSLILAITASNNFDEETKENMIDYLNFIEYVEKLVININLFYYFPESLNVPIWAGIYYMYDRHWWKTE